MGVWTPGPGATGGNDTFDGDATNETVDGLGGDDELNGNAGNDTLTGGEGADTLYGGTGSDDLFGGNGDDILAVQEGEDAGGETYDGGAGTDFLFVAGSVNLISATVAFEHLVFIEGAFSLNAVAFSANNLPSATLTVHGVASLIDIVQVNITGNANLSLAGWTLSGWTDVTDHINIFGGTLDNVITGSTGSDWIQGNEGADTLLGGAGADQLTPSFDVPDSATDEMSGGAGNDFYGVYEATDLVFEAAGEGTDLVSSWINYTLGVNVENLTLYGTATFGAGNGADNNIIGNELDNTLLGANGNDAISGDAGADTITGGIGIDNIAGGAGNDTINWTWGDGADVVDGGADSDVVIVGGNGSSNLLNASWNGTALTNAAGITLSNVEYVDADMGAGTDWLIYTATAGVFVDLSDNSASGFEYVDNVERVIGGSGDDTLIGDGLDNRLDGAAGNDALSGGAGVDTLIGGDGMDSFSGGLGNDSIQGGAGDDTINWTVGDGRDAIDGGADVDAFNPLGSASADLGFANWNGTALTSLMDNGLSNVENINLDLEGGVDWLIYNATAAVSVNLLLGSASGFVFISDIEKVIGGSGDDTLTGNGADNRLDGQGGADTLDGGAGSDAVLGGDGDDVIHASAGNDSLQGQAGDDSFIWTSTDGRDTFNGGADSDTVSLTGSAAADVADANWNGTAITGLMNNALVDIEAVNLDLGAGGAGGDWLRYNTSVGVTVILELGTATGFASITGVENVIGGTGNDDIVGDAGANKINGNAGDDFISGGGGNDNLTGGLGQDVYIYQPGAGADTINDFDAWAVGGQDFLNIAGFGINAGNFAARVTIIDTGADTVVRIDSDVFITLKNVSGDGDNVITISDFILGP
jgi:Ca2+-binding RTX toxin-like protein